VQVCLVAQVHKETSVLLVHVAKVHAVSIPTESMHNVNTTHLELVKLDLPVSDARTLARRLGDHLRLADIRVHAAKQSQALPYIKLFPMHRVQFLEWPYFKQCNAEQYDQVIAAQSLRFCAYKATQP
jgi:hypothetical protein